MLLTLPLLFVLAALNAPAELQPPVPPLPPAVGTGRTHLHKYACMVATVWATCDEDTNEVLQYPHPQEHVSSYGWSFETRQAWIKAHAQDSPAQQASAAQAARDKEAAQ